MKLTGKIDSIRTSTATFSGDVTVTLAIDRPQEKKVTVQLSNGYQTEIADADYTALSAKWATDDDLLAYIAAKNKLAVG